MNLILFSCSEQENNDTLQKKEPELFKDFNLIDGSNFHLAKEDGDPKIKVKAKVTLTIGRRSKGCRKIGICKVKEVAITVEASKSSNDLTFSTQEINGQNYVILALASELNSEDFDTNFYVDEDITDEESGIVVPKGIYNLDYTVGNYGGYKVLLNN
ncbi:hypothetical protein [uncultured Polaribacter sp.]|uniref:hypothetical protein n=1 Tax=uncultured Polaribacter sp. TaxID=174711 RepID=UPI00261E3504|nr:hypothetical protein [uncultured Polaribacter sp.]